MSESFEYIAAFFQGELSGEERDLFNKRVSEDPAFAEEVSFYLLTVEAARQEAGEERVQRFRQIPVSDGGEDRNKQKVGIIKVLRPVLAAAAAVAAIVFSWFTWLNPVTVTELADRYVKENFNVLGVTMDGSRDSTAKGIDFFNAGNLDSAQVYFEAVLDRDSGRVEILEYAGKTCLRLKKFDQAIMYFTKLQNIEKLQVNPGMFYHAVALIERNNKGDLDEAKRLLSIVVSRELPGWDIAGEWLKKW